MGCCLPSIEKNCIRFGLGKEMRTLKDQLKHIQDLKIKCESAIYRYYNRENQLILMKLIIEEMKKWDSKVKLDKDLYLILSNPEKLATKNIEDLCLIYKKIVLLKVI
jgi:hypothetical protein